MDRECGPRGWTVHDPSCCFPVRSSDCVDGTPLPNFSGQNLPVHRQTQFHVSLSPLHPPCSSQSLAAHVPSHGPPHLESSHPLPILLPFCLVLTLCQGRWSPDFPIPRWDSVLII